MLNKIETKYSFEVQTALEIFNPKNFGFEKHGSGYMKEFPDLGPVVIAPVGWETVHVKQADNQSILDIIAHIQETVWGMPPSDIVPTNVLSIVQATGGSTLVAYPQEKGFTPDSWLGFVLGFGSIDGCIVSHMLGVQKDLRGSADIGFNLKLIQAYEALKTGHTKMNWTFDPARGANARLNLEKLGGNIDVFTIDKYGPLHSELYGKVPTDRFTLNWNLTSPNVQKRVLEVQRGTYKPHTPHDVSDVPLVTPQTLMEVAQKRPFQVAFEIPGDIDLLMQEEAEKAITWRQGMRQVLSALMDTETANVPPSSVPDPALLSVSHSQGEYRVTGFATGIVETQRKSYYILTRK
jgi:chorismate synthase